MATIYDIKIKTCSAFVAHDEAYIKEMLETFLKEHRDPKTHLGFEGTEVSVEIQKTSYETPTKEKSFGQWMEKNFIEVFVQAIAWMLIFSSAFFFISGAIYVFSSDIIGFSEGVEKDKWFWCVSLAAILLALGGILLQLQKNSKYL